MPNVRRRVPSKKRSSLVSRRRVVPPRVLKKRISSRAHGQSRSVSQSLSGFWKKVIRLVITSVIGIFLFLVVVFLFLTQQTDWDKKNHLTLLLIDRSHADSLQYPLHLLTISENDQDVAVLSLPPTLQMRALRQYGEFSSDSLYSLYQQEQLSDRYVAGTLTYNLGVVVDQSMFVDQPITSAQELQHVFFSSLFHLNRGEMRWGDRLHIWTLLARYGQVTDIASKYDIFLSDGSSKTRLRPDAMDTVVNRYFRRPQFTKSNWTIAVINLTEESGVATFWGKRMKQAGFQLITVDSLPSEDATRKSIIYLSQKAFDDAMVVKTLQSLFPVELEFQVNQQITQRFRSDVVVYLLEDLVREYP